MRRTGIAELPLHVGRAPPWLISRMRELADKILVVIIEEYGVEELLRRISNPFWFQSLGCILGFDWHSSGLTTVTTGVLKMAAKPEYGFAIAGGKGKASLRAPNDIMKAGEKFSFSEEKIGNLIYASRMSAKVDNAAIQAGYPLYHHAFFIAQEGKWAVVQQGMNKEDRTARRYHWLSDNVKSFVEEPHNAIVCDVTKENVLDMTARESSETRETSLDIVKEGIGSLKRDFVFLKDKKQKTLEEWIPEEKVHVLTLPKNIKWDVLKKAYEAQPASYEELLAMRGLGAATVRGLALISEIVYGEAPSWKGPVKYSFAYGGKDGVPRPVDKKAMDESIDFLRRAVEESKLGDREKIEALRRLRIK